MTVVVFAIVVVLVWVVLSGRIRRLEEQAERDVKTREGESEIVAGLLRRVYALERGQTVPQPAVAEAASRVERPASVPELKPVPIKPLPAVAEAKLATPPPLPALAQLVPDTTAPRETWQDRLRKSVGGPEWEAVVGGSWLNKLGVLVLVIGVALLLGYEFTRVGPGGRVAIGMAIGLTMLTGGALLERRTGYAVFARGLLGGGWATVYFTTYAMHALTAAKVIDNPYLGSALLLAVASAMILHSLRYKSQTVCGLAYFIAFATLALSESTPFSVLALLPLAGSLLFLAYRFDWHKMAVFGLFATYATCASRPDTGAPLSSTQALFGTYWLLFEAFDLLSLRRRSVGWRIESVILPGNALGFLALSLVKWHRAAPAHLHFALAAGAGLYLTSALLRVRIRPPSGFGSDSGAVARMAAGSYEGPITLAAALAAAAIFRGASGEWINLGLLIEGEILFLAGFRFRQTYLRGLAGAAFVATVGKLLAVDQWEARTVALGGRTWAAPSPAAVLTAAVFYLNRVLRVAEGALYTWTAAGLVTLALGTEVPEQYLSVAWLAFAALLFECGFLTRKAEFRYQSYLVGLLGTGAAFLVNAFGGRTDWQSTLLALAICAAIHYAVVLQVRFQGAQRLGDLEQPRLSWATSISASILLAVIAWKIAPGDYLGVVWLVLGALLFELGLRKLPAHFRWQSYFVSALGVSDIFWVHVVEAHKGSLPSEPVSLGIATSICCAMSWRVFRAMPDRIPDEERCWCRDLYAAAGTLFAMTLAWLELPSVSVALAWAVAGLILLEIGFAASLARFRLWGNLVAATVLGRLFLANFTNLGDTLRISHRMLTVLPIVVSQYYVRSRYRQANLDGWERNLARLYLYAPAILVVVLVRFELGRTLAVTGWAVFGLALYWFGLARNIEDLRWQGYAIAALSFWRSWNTNFNTPESLGGIPARVLTGAIVIASFYCAQLLAPRAGSQAGDARGLLDRQARAFYSLLASILLAVLLFYEVSGGVLTMAWGAEALALLGAGFPLRDRVQRLSGLSLFLVCVLKLFLYDLRQLETVNRILSFMVLGLILVGVSWMYTRFRDRIQRYL